MFLVPAKLGVFEGGNALIFSRLGYTATEGIIVSFTMRLSELASALVGLGALAYLYFCTPQLQVASVPQAPSVDNRPVAH